MKKISLEQDENLSIVLSYQLKPKAFQRVDLYISIPEDIGINEKTLTEEQYFNSSIQSHSTYYSRKLHLPLVRSRYISQTKGEQSDYRANLNLFSYQFRIALDADIKETQKEDDIAAFYQQATELSEQTSSLLKMLRRYSPPDQKLSSYFDNVDNFLSWYTEQAFLSLIARAPKTSEFSDDKNNLIDFCRQENKHRIEKRYNSKVTLDDPNRITNKMRLLRRLSEYGVVFSLTTKNLDENLKRLVRGTVTAIIMTVVMAMVLNARSAFTEVTLMLIVVLGGIYGIREIFKDELTHFIWRKIQRGRPKWQHSFFNSLTQNKVFNQTIWLEYMNRKDLPPEVDSVFQQRRQQNKQAAHLLHFRSDSQVIASEFMPGFEEIENKMSFSLRPFIRYLKKGEGRLFHLEENNKINNQAVERRYQLNLVLVQTSKHQVFSMQRFKITLNRSKIINIELIES